MDIKTKVDAIILLLAIAFIVAFVYFYHQIPVCDRMSKDVTPNQLRECMMQKDAVE